VIGPAALLAAAALSAIAPAAAPNAAIGLWRTPEDGGSLVRIEACGEAICGRLVTSPRLRAHPDQKDVRNHDAALRERPVRDLVVFRVRPIGPNRWGDGWLYNPIDGGTYKGAMELQGDGTLRLTGCMAALLCRKQTWERAN
jgi:uncharacterized protein (DUF2147 family)